MPVQKALYSRVAPSQAWRNIKLALFSFIHCINILCGAHPHGSLLSLQVSVGEAGRGEKLGSVQAADHQGEVRA